MIRHIKTITSMMLLILFSYSVVADELKDREKIRNQATHLFQTGDFRKLNVLAQDYLVTEERTSSGLWKLTLFYAGVSQIANKKNTDEKYWNDLEDRALSWVEYQPESPAGHLAYASFLISHAWVYRGGKWARQVKPESWKPFYEHIEKAKKYLLKNKSISSIDPRWYELMIIIARAEGWNSEQFNALLKEGLARHPYFYQIYFAAINYLLPKWHGSKLEVERFAKKAINITKSKENTGLYARVYWYSSQSNYGTKLFTESAVRWMKMSTAIDDVLEIYPDQWNINNFAYFSCLAGDAKKTNTLMNMIQGNPLSKVWGNGVYYSYCKAWAGKNSPT